MTIWLSMNGYGYSKRRCKSIIKWFCDNHLKNHEIEIDVLHRGLISEGAYGWCDVVGKNQFLIEVHSRLSPEEYSTTLLHELQHVKQFVRKDLKIKSGKRYYKGVCIEDIPYEEQEHEQEAHEAEKTLFEGYLTSLQNPARLGLSAMKIIIYLS